MKLTFLKQLVLLVVSGVLMASSFPATGSLFPVVFISFAPVIWFNITISDARNYKLIRRFIGNYMWAISFNLAATWWIKNASFEGALMAVLANSLLMTLPFFLFGFFNKILGSNKGLISLVVLWISFEHIHHQWDLSWPWLSFGNAFGNQPWLIQWYEYTGIQGGTLWVLMTNILVYVIIRNIWERKESVAFQTPNIASLALVITVPVITSLGIFYNYEEDSNPVDICIVQPNLNPWNDDFTGLGPKFTTPLTLQLDGMFKIAENKINEHTSFVLLPETALASNMDESILDNMGAVMKVRQFSSEKGVAVLTGADTYGVFSEERPFPAVKQNQNWKENYNTALLIDKSKPIGIYHKSKLVLGPEKLPFVKLFPVLANWSVSLGGTAGILVGNKYPKVFKINSVKVAPLICYESVYGEFVTEFTKRGAEVLCVITNDGWWGDTPGYKQHLTFSQIRAIENRRSVARSANTGISCFINQKGEVVEKLGWNVEGAISGTVNRNTEMTFYVRYGDLLGRISEFLLIGIFLMAISNNIRRRKKA